jgi:uncharacterized protein YndB with AHSA1/START domain
MLSGFWADFGLTSSRRLKRTSKAPDAVRILVALRVKAPPERAFEAFTREIGAWWRPNGLFQFTNGRPGAVAFEPGPGGRFTETLEDGSVFEIGRISVWEPPLRLVFSCARRASRRSKRPRCT